MLDELHGQGKAPSVAVTAIPSESEGDITDDEFEALLDQLHGAGKHVGRPDAAPVVSADKTTSSESSAEDLITDDDFEKLLDQLHGKGKGPSVADNPVSTSTAAEPQPQIEPVSVEQPHVEMARAVAAPPAQAAPAAQANR